MIEQKIFKSGITNRALVIVNEFAGMTDRIAKTIKGSGQGGRVTVGDAKAFELPFDANKADLATLEAIKPSEADAAKHFCDVCQDEAFALLENNGKGQVKAREYAMRYCKVEKGKSPDATKTKEAMGFIVALRTLSSERYAADAEAMAAKIKAGIISPRFATRWSGSNKNGTTVRRLTGMTSKKHKAAYIASIETASGAARFTDF